MRPQTILIRQGRIIDPSQNLDMEGDLLITNGLVESIGKNIEVGSDIPIVEAKEKWVMPGWIDMHCNLREPGYTHKETIRTATLAAAQGGFTSVLMTPGSSPVNDNSYVTSFLCEKIKQDARVHTFVMGALTKQCLGEELAEMGSMLESGVKAFCDPFHSVQNAYIMRKALDYSKRFDVVVITRPEDRDLRGKGVMNEGFNSTTFGLRGIPAAAEEIMVARDLLLAELTGSRIHFAHLSTAKSCELVAQAKSRGVKVTCGVTPHHLWLTDRALLEYDTNTKVSPPLRDEKDVQAVRAALKSGVIDIVATDHAPQTALEKEVEFDHAEFGIVGLETAASLMFELTLDEGLGIHRMIDALSVKPAAILRLNKGSLKKGSDGDVTIFDPNQSSTIDKFTFASKSQNTPFHQRKVRGRVSQTLCMGEIVFDGKKVIV